MRQLVEEGKARYLGLSEVSVAQAAAHAEHPVTAIQSEFSLWSQDARDPNSVSGDVVGWCAKNGASFAPLGRGFLSGTITSVSQLEKSDFRYSNSRYQDDAIAENLQIVDIVREVAKGTTRPPRKWRSHGPLRSETTSSRYLGPRRNNTSWKTSARAISTSPTKTWHSSLKYHQLSAHDTQKAGSSRVHMPGKPGINHLARTTPCHDRPHAGQEYLGAPRGSTAATAAQRLTAPASAQHSPSDLRPRAAHNGKHTPNRRPIQQWTGLRAFSRFHRLREPRIPLPRPTGPAFQSTKRSGPRPRGTGRKLPSP